MILILTPTPKIYPIKYPWHTKKENTEDTVGVVKFRNSADLGVKRNILMMVRVGKPAGMIPGCTLYVFRPRVDTYVVTSHI